MNKNQFAELLQSVKEMEAIVNDEKPAARLFEIPASGVRALREKVNHPTQKKVKKNRASRPEG